jgi:hypothetical protein
MTDIPQEFLPLYAQKAAEHMAAHGNKKIYFLLITPDRVPTECVWLEPCYGFIAVKGKEESGFIRVKDLPEGSMILNQHYETEDDL